MTFLVYFAIAWIVWMTLAGLERDWIESRIELDRDRAWRRADEEAERREAHYRVAEENLRKKIARGVKRWP